MSASPALQGSRSAVWLAVLYYAIAQWPGGLLPIESGLDNSWMYAMNLLFNVGPVFGREVAFTYGPLGFLLHPRAVEANLEIAMAFWTGLHLATVALLAQAVRQGCFLQVCGMVALSTAGRALGVWLEYWTVLNAGLFAWASLLLSGRLWLWAVVAGALSGALAAMKLTSGAAAFSLVSLALWLAPAPPERKRRACLYAIGGVTAIWLPILVSFFDSPASFFRWLSWSWEISSGYSAAMSLVYQSESLWNAFAILLAFVAFACFGGDRQRRLAASLLFVLFIAFRHGYTRQGTHSMAFYGTFCSAPAMLILFAESRRERIAVMALAAAAISITIFHSSRFASDPPFDWARIKDTVTLRRGFRHLRQTLDPQIEANSLSTPRRGAVGQGELPDPWLNRVSADHGEVASLPWEITGVVSRGLSWRILPSLQLYSAYTATLDKATANIFRREDRPKWIWLMNYEIDNRSQLSDNPETWMAILDNYEPADQHAGFNELLLRARAHSVQTKAGQSIRTVVARSGEWIEVDDPSRLWRAEIDCSPTPLGRLARVLYHWPPVYLEAVRENGGTVRIRILPDTARTGLLLPLMPKSAAETASAFENRPRNLARRFRILLPEGGYFERSVRIRWRPTTRVFSH